MGLSNLAHLGYPEILLALACFLFLFLRLGSRRGSSLPRNWPLLGMLPGELSQLHRLYDWISDILSESGSTFHFRGPWLSGMNMLITSDPDNVNHMFTTNFANYPKGEEFAEIFDFLGDGILTTDRGSWKIQRKAAHARVNDQRFRRFVAATSRDQAERTLVPFLARATEQRSTVDLQDVILRLTSDAACRQVFGVDPGSLSPDLPTVPFAKALDDAVDVLFYRHTVPRVWWKLLRWLRMGEEKKMARARECLDSFVAGQISKRMEKVSKVREDKGEVDKEEEEAAADLLTSYMERRQGDGDIAVESEKFLRDTTMTFLLAARDTLASALTWFFWLISQHPDVEQKILDELNGVLEKTTAAPAGSCGEKPVLFDAEDLRSTVYLPAALHESIRLFPPPPFEHMSAVQADVLPSGHRVDPKSKVFVCLYAMGRSKAIWGQDCGEFKPERWICERGRLKHEPSHRFLCFGSGPRTCIGKDMAFTQMKVVVAAVLYNFCITVVEGHVVEPKITMAFQMKNGLMVRVDNRRRHCVSS